MKPGAFEGESLLAIFNKLAETNCTESPNGFGMSFTDFYCPFTYII